MKSRSASLPTVFFCLLALSFTKLEGTMAALCLLVIAALTLRMLWNLDALSLEDRNSAAAEASAGAKEDDS